MHTLTVSLTDWNCSCGRYGALITVEQVAAFKAANRCPGDQIAAQGETDHERLLWDRYDD